MTADFDAYGDSKFVTMTADEATLNGSTASSAVDLAGWQALNVVAALEAAVNWTAVTASLEESDDNSAWAAVATEDIIFRNPGTGTTDMVHVGYRGKKRYVRSKLDTGGTGKVIAHLSRPHISPFDQATIEAG